MYRTYSIILFSLICFGSLFFSPEIKAEMNVKDCLEADSDCLEEDLEQREQAPLLEDGDEKIEPSNVKTSSLILNIFKIIFALILVILLIYIFLTLLKKKNKLSEQSGVLENLGGISVGQQKSIQIVRIGEKVYALGVGQDVTMLDEIKDEALIHQLKENETSKAQPMTFIQNILTKKQKQQKKETPHFTDTLKLELDKLKQQRSSLMDTDKKEDDRNG